MVAKATQGENMGGFAEIAFAYPTAIYSALLVVVLVYWLLALTGLVDFEESSPDLDGTLGTVAGYLVAFGLGGVPFSIVVSLLVLIAWLLSSLAAEIILPLVPTEILGFIAGSGILIAAFACALPLTAVCVRPMRKLFVSHSAVSNQALVGQRCRILTGSVSAGFGRAEVESRGASFNIRVFADEPNTLARGSPAIILEYVPDTGSYRVQAENVVQI